MNRVRLLRVVLGCAASLAGLPGRDARADPFAAGQSLDRGRVAAVSATALDFVEPRTLEAFPKSRLTLWGLRGLTMLDPDLSFRLVGGLLNLMVAGRPVLVLNMPPEQDARAWGEVVARTVQMAWNTSEAVRRGGTEAILVRFFDELFSHVDAYSRYVPPGAAGEERAARRGRVELGLTVEARGGRPTVVRLRPGGPAAIAGLRVGDRLLSIDGIPIEDAGTSVVAGLLAGDEGSAVVFEVTGRDGAFRSLTATRELVVAETVTATRSGGLLLLRISSFNRDTGANLARELSRAVGGPRPPRGIVLDLRGNRGGLLREAVMAAGTLLADGAVARTAGRDPEAAHDYIAQGRDLAEGRPVVVLVDGRSASAAEVLAAALADDGRAVVVGSATFGKGLVQTIATMPDGGDLFVTWSQIVAPLEWPIQGLGVMPQICTSLGDVRLRAELAQPGAAKASALRGRAARAPLPAAEAIAIRNLCPPAEGREADIAAARFLLDHPKTYEAARILP